MTASKRNGCVYAIKHNPTGRVYVGSTANIDERIRQHMAALEGHNHPVPLMQEDHDRYGADYSVYVLEDYLEPGRALHKLEAAYMTILRTRDPETGYNYLDNTNDFSLCKARKYSFPNDNRKMPRKDTLNALNKQQRRVVEMWCGGATCSEIGQAMGISRQRSHQIVKAVLGF